MNQKSVVDLLNPVRIKIIQTVLQKGETTSKELAESLPDIAIASLYRHVKKLIELNILEVVSETPIRGTVERTFKVKENPFEKIKQLMDDGNSEQHFQMFFSFLMSQLMDFSSYINTPYDMYEDMVGFRTNSFYLSKEESKKFYEELATIFDKYFNFEPSTDRKLMKYSYSMLPIKD